MKKNVLELVNKLFYPLNSSYRLKPELENNIKYKNIHAGKRCFIIGNGSSLKKQNLSPLSDEITFVMNAFWKHKVISAEWQPNYYCFADPVTFDGSSVWVPFFRNLQTKVKESTFFVPEPAKKIIEKQKLLPMDKTYYVSFENTGGEIQKIDLTCNLPSVESTSQLALELALYMGCNPIYLIGMDHDWLAHRSLDKHFYNDKTVDDHPIAHGDLSKYSYKSDLESCLRLWRRYENLWEYAMKRNINIVNVTAGGFLDVFPREKYENLL